MNKLLSKLRVDFPETTFKEGSQFSWSPKNNTITYLAGQKGSSMPEWSLLHELGHALLGHKDYKSDIELLTLESKAWEKAKELGYKYGYKIDEDHIQDCMDTYRDWLHQRSSCPTCNNRSLQQDSQHYRCFNCGQTWAVSNSRFCRPYRRKVKNKTSPPNSKVMFA